MRTNGVMYGNGVLQKAPSRLPGLIEWSTWFSLNTFAANPDIFGLNLASESNTSLIALS